MSDALDLSAFDLRSGAEKGAKLQLLHPVSGDAINVCIVMRGADAPSYRQVIRGQIDQQISEGKTELSAAELETCHVERLAAATLSWKGVVYEGAELACTAANVKRLYSEQLWIREQVARFMEDRAHFLSE